MRSLSCTKDPNSNPPSHDTARFRREEEHHAGGGHEGDAILGRMGLPTKERVWPPGLRVTRDDRTPSATGCRCGQGSAWLPCPAETSWFQSGPEQLAVPAEKRISPDTSKCQGGSSPGRLPRGYRGYPPRHFQLFMRK